MPTVDLSDRIFGKLVVVDREYDPRYKRQQAAVWYCVCECGGFKRVTTHGLTKRGISDCGCERDMPERRDDLQGQIFGKLTVLFRTENVKGRTAWITQCECGTYRKVLSSLLKAGKVACCGCTKTGKAGRKPMYTYDHIGEVCRIPRIEGNAEEQELRRSDIWKASSS